MNIVHYNAFRLKSFQIFSQYLLTSVFLLKTKFEFIRRFHPLGRCLLKYSLHFLFQYEGQLVIY